MAAKRSGAFFGPAAAILLALALFGCLFLVFGDGPAADPEAFRSASGKWTCSMCPQFILPEPGKCPKCFMDLIPLEEGALGGSRRELLLTPETARLAGITTAVAEVADDDTRDAEGILLIPATAVLENLGRRFVYTESEDGEHLIFTMREIETAGRRDGMVRVVSGLDEGEVVAAGGVFRIDSAMQILGKASLTNLPAGDLADVDETDLEPYQPAERSGVDLRAMGAGVDEWFGRYESVRAALAADDLGAARRSAQALLDAVSARRAPEGAEEIAALAKDLAGSAHTLAEAESLDGSRDAFERVSAGMVLLARRFGSPAGGLNLVFCPMAFGGAGAYWLQPQDTVDNPYHGLEMPLCGWHVEKIAE